MVEEHGRRIAMEVAFQHLLRTLERKGVMSPSETTAMLDGVLDELDRRIFANPDQKAQAHIAVGGLYLPI